MWGEREPEHDILANSLSPHTPPPFRVSRLTSYVQSIFCDIALVSNTDPWIYILQQQYLQQQIVTSPIHNKTQRWVSPGTHVAVLALMRLEEPPTACGVPLSSVAKSSPPSVLLKFQESLHRSNSIPAGFFIIKDLQNPQ